jgi:alpha-tubulin suppressor-like RCC1 family protein
VASSAQVSSAGCGRHHTVFVAEGKLHSCGRCPGGRAAAPTERHSGEVLSRLGCRNSNRAGQLGNGKVDEDGKSEPQSAPKALKDTAWAGGSPVLQAECGAEYSAACSASGVLATWGHPEHGQLGNGTDGETIAKQVRPPRPRPTPGAVSI